MSPRERILFEISQFNSVMIGSVINALNSPAGDPEAEGKYVYLVDLFRQKSKELEAKAAEILGLK